MNSYSSALTPDDTTSFPHPTFDLAETPEPVTGQPAPGMVRILLGVDVPASLLPDIEADWALVAAAQQDAPDIAAAAIGSGLARLQRHTANVSGVAVVERLENPFMRWMPRAA